MTLFRGMLLFDVAEQAVGKWENQLGYRGMMEVWLIPGTDRRIEIDCDESYKGDPEHDPAGDGGWEVRLETDNKIEYFAFGAFAQCDEAAKAYMREHPESKPSHAARSQ